MLKNLFNLQNPISPTEIFCQSTFSVQMPIAYKTVGDIPPVVKPLSRLSDYSPEGHCKKYFFLKNIEMKKIKNCCLQGGTIVRFYVRSIHKAYPKLISSAGIKS